MDQHSIVRLLRLKGRDATSAHHELEPVLERDAPP
jgi:hypothetical protein